MAIPSSFRERGQNLPGTGEMNAVPEELPEISTRCWRFTPKMRVKLDLLENAVGKMNIRFYKSKFHVYH